MKKYDKAPPRIERATTIPPLTKKRHLKLSFSQFHKSIILMIALINNTHLIDLMPQHEQTSKNQTAGAKYLPKNPSDERTSQQYLMPYVHLVQYQ
ncbi:hypothetical protein P303_04760 [Xylella fastidiosa MUL0034]|nr:hypothetical protein P303_04760 [Xylella fastidiosa MUL0034]